jgi:hypothetical protein
MVIYGKYGFERMDERNIVLGVVDKKSGELKQNTATFHGSIPSTLRALRERVLQDKAFYGASNEVSFEDFIQRLDKACKEFDKAMAKVEFGIPNLEKELPIPEVKRGRRRKQ